MDGGEAGEDIHRRQVMETPLVLMKNVVGKLEVLGDRLYRIDIVMDGNC